jgi:hypothetical protein
MFDVTGNYANHFHHVYPVEDLPGELWYGLTPEVVDWRTVTPTQFPAYHPCGLVKKRLGEPSRNGDPYPYLLVYGTRIYLYDGHHRVGLELKEGRTHGKAKVYRWTV